MSIYDNFADAPNQIKTEGQEITLKFQRTGETTARVSWNIPPPAQGCSSDVQAYDGIVITASNSPANYISTSPKDAVYYEGDPTADYDIHSGSVIDNAYVIAALYHDKSTTMIDIDGIEPRTPYYISGYAVDNVGRYHREGVHAYSLPTGEQTHDVEDSVAKHDVMIFSNVPILPKSPTGLNSDTIYTLPLSIGCEKIDYSINGSNALTYGQLVKEINKQFIMSDDAYNAPLPPKSGHYHLGDNTQYSIWDGHKLIKSNVLFSDQDPLIPQNGTYWLSQTDNVLRVRVLSGWDDVADVIKSSSPPTELNTYTVWFDGITVRIWEDGHWCDYVTIISDHDPQLPPNLTVNDYWFKSIDNEMFKWNDVLQKWDDALVIFYDQDPNMFIPGNYWYDETNLKVNVFDGSVWNIVEDIIYADATKSGNLPAKYDVLVVANKLWFDTKNIKLFRRNTSNTDWVPLKFVSFPKDPMDRKSCDVWWNSSDSIDDLFVWESVSALWIPINNFYRQDTDPNSPPLLDEKTAWVDLNGTISLITAQVCNKVNYINSTTNPRDILASAIWLDDNGSYHIFDGIKWNIIDNIIRWDLDPFVPFAGMIWHSSVTDVLSILTDGIWIEKCLVRGNAIFPKAAALWFDTINEILFTWLNGRWVPTQASLRVNFVKRECLDGYDVLSFMGNKAGCGESFEVLSIGNTLFNSLVNSVIYTDPLDSADGVSSGPMYKHLSVGDDGSPDERRALHEDLRMTLGFPSVRVELTKQQLDKCIDNALLVLRKNSTYAYQKAMFFLTLNSNQQIYLMSNRCVGFNAIVDVLDIHRVKAAAFKTAYSQNDNFSYAALQQLYTLGTFDMLTFHLTSAYVEELETIFASRIMFQWVERKRELKLFQVPRSKERVLIEAVIEKPEQELLTDRETAYWVKRWALVEAKGMLSQIRGKFITLPGPNGTTTLNYTELQTQLEQERLQLLEEVQSTVMQDLVDIGMKAHFVIG